ncbi:uncharacterized protein YndB with AHSA1/START domain [Novosphingobium hassiacum]|uniref:Uncharacterized protein YndB with AHSA1/START domain n=1 Tax=Novosphingobium hassiacum TaxID=173676 RepID=A0A7W5ZVA6_9SPHN|nr:SRPBCC domain-containing protein [Novosphingobium hassiacum]MBB3860620.1 uncharacterized protein YndB with AHSA1/START domain [Novosphingobium hassiacum]
MSQDSGKRSVSVERISDREFAITRSFDAPAALVFEAWSKPELFRQWWTPKSFGMTIVSCEMDVRTGGTYRLEIGHPSMDQPMAFFGRYLEVVPSALMVWTNDENGEGPVTRVTFAEAAGRTTVVYSNVFATAQAMEDELASGACDGMGETFTQLDTVLAG